MIGMKLNQAKSLFFDRPKILAKVDTATRKVFSKFGAFVRQTAKNSIKKNPDPAPPGSPPSSHTGLLKKFIFFGYDADRRSVIIGPTRLNQRGRGLAPSLLEHGGKATIKRYRKRKRVTYKPRPYMGPAFEKEQSQLPALWRGSVK